MKTFQLSVLCGVGLAAGCGGGGGSSSPITTTNPFAGSYTGNVNLDGGKTGALALSVASTGNATGTLTVSAPPEARSSSFNFTVGTHQITGTVGQDGTLNLSGTDSGTGAGSFQVGGRLTSSGGSLTVLAGGQSFTGTISTGTGGGGGSITFSGNNGSNADLSAYPANPMVFMSTVAGASAIVVSPPGGGNARTLQLMLGPSATPGTTVTLTGNRLAETTFGYGEQGTKFWRASSGTMKINSRTASTFSVTLTNVVVTADTETGATGSFRVNGTLSK